MGLRRRTAFEQYGVATPLLQSAAAHRFSKRQPDCFGSIVGECRHSADRFRFALPNLVTTRSTLETA
ncbi:MAG TPA: hypothetical protein V6D34_00095 [Candidatus Sericytochromatia bacterium]